MVCPPPLYSGKRRSYGNLEKVHLPGAPGAGRAGHPDPVSSFCGRRDLGRHPAASGAGAGWNVCNHHRLCNRNRERDHVSAVLVGGLALCPGPDPAGNFLVGLHYGSGPRGPAGGGADQPACVRRVLQLDGLPPVRPGGGVLLGRPAVFPALSGGGTYVQPMGGSRHIRAIPLPDLRKKERPSARGALPFCHLEIPPRSP